MKLSYRGVNYQPEPLTWEINEGEIGGKYRGQQWRTHYPRHIPQLQPKIFMQYRGVAYSTCPLPKREGCEEYLWESSVKSCQISPRKTPKVLTQDATSIHLENIRRNLERRLQVAKANGDQHLIDLLLKESQQLATSKK